MHTTVRDALDSRKIETVAPRLSILEQVERICSMNDVV